MVGLPYQNRFAAEDSIDGVDRAHDISRTADPGHCPGALI